MSLTILNNLVNKIFYKCVELLEIWAEALGISYELINIIIFIIGYPLFVLGLLLIIKSQRKKIWQLEKVIQNHMISAPKVLLNVFAKPIGMRTPEADVGV